MTDPRLTTQANDSDEPLPLEQAMRQLYASARALGYVVENITFQRKPDVEGEHA